MARNKTSNYNVTEGLNFNVAHEVHEVHEVQELNSNTQQVQYVQEVKKKIGNTQGKKGLKLKRINMAFSDDNHDYITRKSRQMGISATAFVNLIIEQYKNNN